MTLEVAEQLHRLVLRRKPVSLRPTGVPEEAGSSPSATEAPDVSLVRQSLAPVAWRQKAIVGNAAQPQEACKPMQPPTNVEHPFCWLGGESFAPPR